MFLIGVTRWTKNEYKKEWYRLLHPSTLTLCGLSIRTKERPLRILDLVQNLDCTRVTDIYLNQDTHVVSLSL